MGCDIHLHVEVKIAGVWHHYHHPSVNRNYALFARLGVRDRSDGEIEPMPDLPVGIPEDASALTRFSWERDVRSYPPHHPSWIGVRQIAELENWIKNTQPPWSDRSPTRGHDLEYDILKCYFFGNGFSDLHRYGPSEVPVGVEDVRFVFWFDN